jgi:hypothetical protein
VEFSVKDAGTGISEVFALITTLLDPEAHDAGQLARLYAERWRAVRPGNQSRSTGSPVSASTKLIASTGQDAAASRTASSGAISAASGPDCCLSSSANRPGAVPTHTADPMQVPLSTATTQRVMTRPI